MIIQEITPSGLAQSDPSVLDALPGVRWSVVEMAEHLRRRCHGITSPVVGIIPFVYVDMGVPYSVCKTEVTFEVDIFRKQGQFKCVTLRYQFTGHALKALDCRHIFPRFILKDVRNWVEIMNLPDSENLDEVLNAEVGRVWDTPGVLGCQLGRIAKYSPFYRERAQDLQSELYGTVAAEMAASVLFQDLVGDPGLRSISTPVAPDGVFGLDFDLFKPPIDKSPQTCSKCNAPELKNFIRHGDVLVCLSCHVPKKCADCDQPENLEFYTSQKDGREICAECFRKLNAQSRAREKGFKINGERWVDREDEEKAMLRRRRVQNSITYARGLKEDGLASTKSQAEGIMKVAGCRYVREALRYVGFHTAQKSVEPQNRNLLKGWTAGLGSDLILGDRMPF